MSIEYSNLHPSVRFKRLWLLAVSVIVLLSFYFFPKNITEQEYLLQPDPFTYLEDLRSGLMIDAASSHEQFAWYESASTSPVTYLGPQLRVKMIKDPSGDRKPMVSDILKIRNYFEEHGFARDANNSRREYYFDSEGMIQGYQKDQTRCVLVAAGPNLEKETLSLDSLHVHCFSAIEPLFLKYGKEALLAYKSRPGFPRYEIYFKKEDGPFLLSWVSFCGDSYCAGWSVVWYRDQRGIREIASSDDSGEFGCDVIARYGIPSSIAGDEISRCERSKGLSGSQDTYSNDDLGFRLNVPRDFKIQSKEDGPRLVLTFLYTLGNYTYHPIRLSVGHIEDAKLREVVEEAKKGKKLCPFRDDSGGCSEGYIGFVPWERYETNQYPTEGVGSPSSLVTYFAEHNERLYLLECFDYCNSDETAGIPPENATAFGDVATSFEFLYPVSKEL